MVWREADLLECEISSRCVRDGRAGCFDAGMTLCLNGIKNCVDLYEHCCTSISSKNPYLDTCYKSRKANRYPYRTLIRRVRTLVDRWESQRNGVGSAVASPSSRETLGHRPLSAAFERDSQLLANRVSPQFDLHLVALILP